MNEPEESEFIVQLGNQIHRYDLELERLQRIQGIFAASMLKIEQHQSAICAEFQQMKNQIAGITPDGLEPR